MLRGCRAVSFFANQDIRKRLAQPTWRLHRRRTKKKKKLEGKLKWFFTSGAGPGPEFNRDEEEKLTVSS